MAETAAHDLLPQSHTFWHEGAEVQVYHFVPHGHGLQNLRHRWLKAAKLAGLNDPFDFACLTSGDHAERKRLREYKRDKSEEFALLCFSGGWHNPVQWSHYAEKHKGFALCFEVPDDQLLKVEYGRKRPIFSAGASEAELLKIANYKFSHWSYERERRAIVLRENCVIDPETGNWFYRFDNSLVLREVILGARCPAKMAEVVEALGDLAANTALRRARLSFQRFAVVTQQKRSFWDTHLE